MPSLLPSLNNFALKPSFSAGRQFSTVFSAELESAMLMIRNAAMPLRLNFT